MRIKLRFMRVSIAIILMAAFSFSLRVYAKDNDLVRYIDERAIAYLVDFEIMLSGAEYRKRGGYDRPDFLARLEPIKVFRGVPPGAKDLALYRVSR